MSHTYIINIVYNSFVKKDVRGIMLTGSYATETQNENSDIDIVILSKFACRQTTAEVVEANIRIHYIIFPQNKIYDLIFDDIFTGKFVFFSIFSKGEIILDTDRTLFSVKMTIRDFTPSLSEHLLVNLLHNIMEDLSYLKKNKEAFSIALNVCIRTQQFIVGFLAPQCRYLDKAMKSFPTHRRILNNALSNYARTKDVSVFSQNIKKIIDEFSTIPHEYSSSDTLLRVPESESIMIFIPNAKLLDNCVMDIFKSCLERFLSINIFAYYIGSCNIQACGSYIAITSPSSLPSAEMLTFLKNYITKENFRITPLLYAPYNTIFFNLNLFGDKKYKNCVYCLFAKCSSWLFNLNNTIPFNGVELGYIITIHLFRLLGKQRKYFILNAFMLYLPDAINIDGHAQHLELAHRYKKLMKHLNVSYNKSKDFLQYLFKVYFKSGAYELKQYEEICESIMEISFASKQMPYNSFYFLKKEYSIIFNIFNQILSIFSLDSYQKITIIFNCSKINTDVLF